MEKSALDNMSYHMDGVQELLFTLLLRPETTGLDMDIFVDDCCKYQIDEHPLLLFVRNSIDSSVNDFFPMSVSDSPVVLDPTVVVKLPENAMADLKTFVIVNRSVLKSFADGLYNNYEEFENALKRKLK